MFKKSIILVSLFFAGCNVFAEDTSKLTHLNCRYDHSKTEFEFSKNYKGGDLESIKNNEVGYSLMISPSSTTVYHTFYWSNDDAYLNSDAWKKKSKWEKESSRMLFIGDIVYDDIHQTISAKFNPHPLKLGYSSSINGPYYGFSRMTNMISRRNGLFQMLLSNDEYSAILTGKCSVTTYDKLLLF